MPTSLRHIFLLFCTASLAGCAATSEALTYGSEEAAWKKARDEAKVKVTQKQYAEAVPLYIEAVNHARKVESLNPYNCATTLIDQADNYMKLGKPAEATAAYQAARDLTNRILANKESSLLYTKMQRYEELRTCLGLGRIYRQSKDYKKAAAEFELALNSPNAHAMKSYTLFHELQREYADMLDESGTDPEKAKKLRDDEVQNRDGLLDGL